MKKKYLLLVLVLAVIRNVDGQNVSFNGLGRMYVTDDHLKGNRLNNDTISKNAGTGGYIIFDLGLNVHPNELIKASAILRSRNEFGGFYGDGASFIFRQFKLEGIIGSTNSGVKYEVGDLDLKMTNYTLYNNEEIYHSHEAEVFKSRRDIVSYENFNLGNTWRLQGAHLATNFIFDKLIKNADINFFATRTKSSLTYAFPDRFILGGRVGITQSKNFKLGGNIVNLIDAKETVAKATYQYQTTVLTGDYLLKLLTKEKFELTQSSEVGNSNFSYNNYTAGKSNTLKDFFVDLNLTALYKPLNFTAAASYRNVGPNFISPSAQTRRIYDYGTPTIFGQVDKGITNRMPTLFDRYTQEGIYNQSIMTVLMPFNPIYNNVSPYGKATPNRQGFSISFSAYDTKQIVSADVNIDALSEITGEGTTNLRNFMSIKGGATFNISKLIKINKTILFSIGNRYESTQRDIAVVNLTSNLTDMGFDIEVVKKISLLFGYKYLSASGIELLAVRNEYNTITQFVPLNNEGEKLNITQGILTFGGRFMLGQYSGFSAQVHLMNNVNKDNGSADYNLTQYFASYTLKF